MRVLVTGAGGKLGEALARLLPTRGHEVLAFDRCSLDIRDETAVRRALAEAQPEAVCQCAAWTDVDGAERDPDGAFSVNAEGARIVAAACGSASSPPWLLHVSTDFVFDAAPGRPCREEDPASPRGVYARSKREGEVRVLGVLPAALVLRTAWLYGGRGTDFVRKVLARAREGGVLRVVEDQFGSPTWVEDLSEAMCTLLGVVPRPQGLLHVANGGGCSRWELASACVRLAGLEAEVVPIRTEDLPAGGAPRPAWSVLDCSRFEALAGAPLRGWKEALSQYLRHGQTA